jgi:tRNA(Arg) A34 adenosine deaminase TadA
MQKVDERLIRRAIAIAEHARKRGNHPFGALLADSEGSILLEAENTVVTEKDCTGHAETNLMRKASNKYDQDTLAKCTLYTSTEPCPMCTGAIFWGNVRRIVFGLSENRLYKIVGEGSDEALRMPCRELLSRGKKIFEVVGPSLEDEAAKVHEGFWI